jgi:ATP adenylyltransferase
VQALVSGRDVAHFHEHVFVRHTGTPGDVEWWQAWSGAPRGDIPEFANRLRTRMAPRAAKEE